MKKTTLFLSIAFCLNIIFVNAQNLVPNPGFETFTSCPTTDGQINLATGWVDPTGTGPDFFNVCATPTTGVAVPNNNYGTRTPFAGNGYAGFFTYFQNSFFTNVREYIQIQLTTTLTASTVYSVSFYVSRGDASDYAASTIGAHFSPTAINPPSPTTGAIIPQVANSPTNVIADTSNWVLIGGTFTAAGGEQYITIGNFRTSATSNPVFIGPTTTGTSYYYIDNVSVTIACATPTQPGSIIGNTVLCSGSLQNYSVAPVGGATSYTWTLPGGWTGSSITNSISTTSGTMSGIISVAASNTCGASTAQTLSVTVSSIPSIPGVINGPNNLCTGAGATSYSIAFVIGATSYTWILPGGWSGTSSTNTISATPGTSGNISVTASNACGASSASIKSVTVNPLPTINATTNNTLLCVGQSATLTASGASTYTWNPGGAGTNITVSPSVTSTYTITGTGTNGCSNSSVFTQSVSACTGISQYSNLSTQISIYPNPFNNKITIVTSSIIETHIQIFNALGLLIYSSEIKEEKTEIDLTQVPIGIYFVIIKTKNNSVTKKIVKQ